MRCVIKWPMSLLLCFLVMGCFGCTPIGKSPTGADSQAGAKAQAEADGQAGAESKAERSQAAMFSSLEDTPWDMDVFTWTASDTDALFGDRLTVSEQTSAGGLAGLVDRIEGLTSELEGLSKGALVYRYAEMQLTVRSVGNSLVPVGVVVSSGMKGARPGQEFMRGISLGDKAEDVVNAFYHEKGPEGYKPIPTGSGIVLNQQGYYLYEPQLIDETNLLLAEIYYAKVLGERTWSA